MTDLYAPKPEDRFTFGLWTVGNTGRDPFGEADAPEGAWRETYDRLYPLYRDLYPALKPTFEALG